MSRLNRRRQATWIQKWARPLIAAIAVVGAAGTAYLTITKLMGGSAACPTSACDQVLYSPYAEVFGLPLSLFGSLAYIGMGIMAVAPLVISEKQQPDLQRQLNHWTWLGLFIGAVAMVVFSGYLMYLLAFQIQAACIYCITSALLTVALLVITLAGNTWNDRGQLFFLGIIVAVLVSVGALGVFASADSTGTIGSEIDQSAQQGPAITTTSGQAEIALARHLTETGAQFYGAWWCPHCYDQKQLFGQEAFTAVNYVECASPDDPRQQAEACQTAGITSYPTWQINGELYPGQRTLDELADLSGYTGPRDFQAKPVS
ncbi:MAG: vitamin K epoxide reductase family protein [Thainema sp.]